MNAYLLSLLIFIPLFTGAILVTLPRRLTHIAKAAALFIASLEFVLSLWLWVQVQPQGGYQLVQKLSWIPFLNIHYHVGVDGISLFLVLLSSLFTLLALVYAWHQIENNAGRFFGLVLLLEAGLLGTVLALDLVVFYLFWELMLIPMFFLIGIWGGAQRIRTVTKFVIYTMSGSLVLLLSILFLGAAYRSQMGAWSFDLTVLTQLQLPVTPMVDLLFWGFALAFLIKLPIFPLHTWLPDTYTEAPPVVTFLLSGVMAKMGVYGLLRITIPLFPGAMERWSSLLSFLAIIGIIYGAIVALGQVEIKRLIAYSSLSHMGLIALGVFNWNPTSLEGVVYHMLNHAVATGGLFLLVGIVEQKYGTTQIKELGGIAKQAPIFAGLFLLMSFASIGVPGLNGFVGEFLILLGVASESASLAILAALTLILSAAYMLWLTQRFLFGALQAPVGRVLSIDRLQLVSLLPLCILAILMGLYTRPFMQYIGPAVQDVITRNQTPIQAQTEGASHG